MLDHVPHMDEVHTVSVEWRTLERTNMDWYSKDFHRTSGGLRAGINTLDAPTERPQGR